VRGSRVRPIAALRDVAIDRSGLSVRRLAAGLLIAGAGGVAFVAGLGASGTDGLPLIGLGAVAVVLGTFTLGPVLVGPVVRVLGAPTRFVGVTGDYARRNAQRNPKRTAATASALMIGVALVGFITIFAASAKASIAGIVDRSFRADYVIESGSFTQGFGVGIEDDLRAVPGVDRLSPVRSAPADVDGSTADVMAVDSATVEGLYDLGVSAGSLASVQGTGLAVSADAAEDRGLAIGDPVPVRFADGEQLSLLVQAVFDGNTVGGEASWIVGLDTFEAHVADQFDRRVFVAFEPGSSPVETRAALDATLAGWPNAEVQDQAEFKAGITGQIDQLLNLIYGLLALAVVISLIGIANTLALSVHERRRELGLLRAIGMQRRQLRRAVRAESMLIAALGTVLGGALAVGAAWAVVRALGDQGITELALPPGQLAVIGAMAGVAGVLAATGPARRAARADVLGAIASE
jgi:putative ABC transport system permease protein